MSHEIHTDAVVRSTTQMQAKAPVQSRAPIQFDYNAPAELFPSRVKKGRTHVRYMRFDAAAEAIRFVVEDVPPPALLGAYLRVDEARLGLAEISELYQREDFPLKRAAARKG